MINDGSILSERNVGYILEKYYGLSNLGGDSNKPATPNTVATMLDVDVVGSMDERQLSAENLKYLLSKISLNDNAPYRKLSYIQSDGTQYIDTGIMISPTERLQIEMDCDIMDVGGGYTGIFGSRYGPSNSPVCAIALWRNGSVSFRADYDTRNQQLTGPTTYGRQQISWTTDLAYGDINVAFDHVDYDPKSYAAFNFGNQRTSSDITMAIFTVHTDDEYDDRCSTMKLYSFKMWDSRYPDEPYEFVPAKRVFDGKYGLYCDKTKQFYPNLGLGVDFTPGEDLGPMGESEYTMLEYIQSQATGPSDGSYIDLGRQFKGKYSEINATFQYVSVDNHTHCALFGARGPASLYQRRLVFQYYNNGWRYDLRNANHEIADPDHVFDKLDLRISRGNLTLSSQKSYYPSSFDNFWTRANVYLFANNTDGSVGECSNLKLYYFSYVDTENDSNNLELYPAKRNSDGELGMLDTLTNTFYPRTGGLPFIEGPVKQPEYIYYEYIQSQATSPTDGSYIDLGKGISVRSTIEAKFQYVDVSNHTHCALFGIRSKSGDYNNRFTFQYNNNGWRCDYHDVNHSLSDPSGIFSEKILNINDGKRWSVSNSDGSDTLSTSFSYNIDAGNYAGATSIHFYLFAQGTADVIGECSNVKLFYINITSQTDVWRLRPCKRTEDGQVGLINVNDGTFYPQTGGLPFIPGPKI